MKRTTTLSTLTLVAALTMAACGQRTETGDTGTLTTSAEAVTSSPETTTETTTAQTPGEIAAEHNNTDIMFTRMMIPHHQQAVEMSEILLSKDNIPREATDFAQRVMDTQTAEIDQMNAMLETWDRQPRSGNMGGMMGREGMTALENTEGAEAVRLYLEHMIPHHEGAIDMARNQINNGGNPQAIALAEQMITTQEAEITEMEQMLQNL